MSSPEILMLREDEMPLPMGVMAASGTILPALTAGDLSRIGQDPNAVQTRGHAENTDFLAVSDVDPNNLAEAGWGIIFPSGLDPSIRKALEPLIEHRRSQVGDPSLFRIFDGPAGYQDGDTVRSWLDRFSVGLATVDPSLGVPLYLAIVGTPEQIPFEFQYLLDAYWCVGRICFDSTTEYRAYAEGVVAYETAPKAPHSKRIALFNTRNL